MVVAPRVLIASLEWKHPSELCWPPLTTSGILSPHLGFLPPLPSPPKPQGSPAPEALLLGVSQVPFAGLFGVQQGAHQGNEKPCRAVAPGPASRSRQLSAW